MRGMLSKDTLTGRKLIVLKRKASRTANNLAVYHKSSSIPSSSFSPQGCSFKLAAVCFFFFLMGVWGRELASSHSELSCDHLFFPPHVVRFPKWLYFFFSLLVSHYPSNFGGCVYVTFFYSHLPLPMPLCLGRSDLEQNILASSVIFFLFFFFFSLPSDIILFLAIWHHCLAFLQILGGFCFFTEMKWSIVVNKHV